MVHLLSFLVFPSPSSLTQNSTKMIKYVNDFQNGSENDDQPNYWNDNKFQPPFPNPKPNFYITPYK